MQHSLCHLLEHQSKNVRRRIGALVDEISLALFQDFLCKQQYWDRAPFKTVVPFDILQYKHRLNATSLIDHRLQIKLLFNNQQATKQTGEESFS